MALQKTFTTKFGVNGDYIKIEDYAGDKMSVTISVSIYADAQARTDNKRPLELLTYVTSVPTTDIMPALYDHLKTLPEFSGAIDV